MNSFTISRSFKGPRSLVFDCWVKPDRFEHWFAPADCETKLLYADVRPGGYFHLQTRSPDGKVFYTKHEFREISPIDRMVFVISFCGVKGEFAKHPIWPNWPDRLLTTVTFEDDGPAATKVTVLWEPFEVPSEQTDFFMQRLDGCHAGWSDTFDKIERTIDAQQPVSSGHNYE